MNGSNNTSTSVRPSSVKSLFTDKDLTIFTDRSSYRRGLDLCLTPSCHLEVRLTLSCMPTPHNGLETSQLTLWHVCCQTAILTKINKTGERKFVCSQPPPSPLGYGPARKTSDSHTSPLQLTCNRPNQWETLKYVCITCKKPLVYFFLVALRLDLTNNKNKPKRRLMRFFALLWSPICNAVTDFCPELH